MFTQMSSGEVKAHSELGTRDESKQVRNFGTRIQKLKTVTGINARILVMKDISIPFNPFTCEEDDNYNAKTPFRPILLASQTLEGIVQYCKQNAEVAKKWERYIKMNLAEDHTLFEVYNAFKGNGYVFPRVMSYSTVAMNFGGKYNFPNFRVKYTVDPTKLNDQGSYDSSNAPIWHKAAIFFNAILRPEADEIKQKMTDEGATQENILKQRSAVFSKSPVGFVGPTNLVPFFYFPLKSDLPDFKVGDNKAIEASMRFYSFTDKWVVPLKEALENPMYDQDIDYFDFRMRTPSSKETKPDGKVYTDEDFMALYTAMQVTNIDGRIALHGGSTVVDGSQVPNEEYFEEFHKAAADYFIRSQEESSKTGGETFEQIMALSNRFRPVDTILDNFLPACNDVFSSSFATSKHFTEAIKKANSEFLVAMNPSNAVALAEFDEDELEEAAKGQNIQDLIADVKDASDEDSVDLTELDFVES